MKKGLTILFLMLLSIVFVGCENVVDEPTLYKLTVIDKDKSLQTSLNSSYEEGTEISFKLQVKEHTTYVVELNKKELEATIDNFEAMLNYSFKMPKEDTTLEIKTIVEEVSTIGEIFNLTNIELKDIKKVRYEQMYIGVAPGSLTNIEYSNNEEDIKNVYDLLSEEVYLETSDDFLVVGGGAVLYTIYTENESYDFKITNNYIYKYPNYYRFEGKYAKINHPSKVAHSFITYNYDFETYTKSGIKVNNDALLNEYEFKEAPTLDSVNLRYSFPVYLIGHLETAFGKIYIHSAKTFSMTVDGVLVVYEIVGEKDFKFLEELQKENYQVLKSTNLYAVKYSDGSDEYKKFIEEYKLTNNDLVIKDYQTYLEVYNKITSDKLDIYEGLTEEFFKEKVLIIKYRQLISWSGELCVNYVYDSIKNTISYLLVNEIPFEDRLLSYSIGYAIDIVEVPMAVYNNLLVPDTL